MSVPSKNHNILLVKIQYIFRTNRLVKDVNKTGFITYLEKGREVLLKSRRRENLKSGSVMGLIVASEQNNPKKEVAMSSTRVQYSNLEIKEFTSSMVKRKGSSYKILEPFIGNILIIAIKRPK